MKLIFAEQAWDDYLHWQETDKKDAEAHQRPDQRDDAHAV